MTKEIVLALPWVADPTEEDFAASPPELGQVIRQIQAMADEWAVTGRIPDGDPVLLTDVSAAGEIVQGDVRAHLRHLTTRGAEGAAIADSTENWSNVVPYFRSRAATQLAKMALAGTGLTAKEVVSAMFLVASKQSSTSIIPDDDLADAPSAWATVLFWLAEHLGPDGDRADRATEAVDVRYLILAFRKIETAESAAQIEEAEQRASDADARAASLEKALVQTVQVARPIPELSTGTLHALMARASKSIRRARRQPHLGADQRKILKEFEAAKLETVSHHELYVLVVLATLAKSLGLLQAHPWAITPKVMEPPGRIRVPFPGYSELARILNMKEDKDGRIPKSVRKGLEDAVNRLSSEDRFIVVRVAVAGANGKTQFVESVSRDKWIVKTIIPETGETFLDIHPATIATALRSYTQVDSLPSRYEAARETLQLREIRRDHVAAELYMRQLQLGTFGATRGRARALAKQGKEAPGIEGPSLAKKVAHETLLDTLNLKSYAKKNGRKAVTDRIIEDLNFCKEVGSLLSFAVDGSNWELVLPDPDNHAEQAIELPLLDEVDEDEISHPGLDHA